ncbi:hypothetical protein VTO73DRAFT_594 [Trametes versicolor]
MLLVALQPIQKPGVENGTPNSNRPISPSYDVGSDSDNVQRAVSPSGRSKTPNGTAISGIASMKGKSRARDEEYDGESSPENTESAFRDSAVSPEGTRAKSPPNTASRAVSPAQGVDVYDPNAPQASLASVMMSRNGGGGAARSPSPVVADRSKNTLESFYKPASPTVNGFAHIAHTKGPGLADTGACSCASSSLR